jgi:hypothetical protein
VRHRRSDFDVEADATSTSFLALWPTGQPRPLTAANNALPGLIAASAGIFQLGDNGQLSVYNASSNVNVILDVTGSIGFQGGDREALPE